MLPATHRHQIITILQTKGAITSSDLSITFMKRLLLFLLVFVLAACGSRASQQPDDSGISMDLTAESTEVGKTTLRITLEDAQGTPINDATLDVKGDMTHAGMVPVLANDVTNGQDGVYEIPFEWTMGGDWIVTVEATLADGRTISRRFDLTVSGGMGEMEGEGG